MAQGSIKRHVAKDGTVTYRVRVDQGVDPVTGKRKRPMQSFRTKKEAEAAQAQWRVQIERGTAVDTSRLTVADYLRHWLATSAQPNVRPSTYASYESLIRVRIIPAIGKVPLQRLTALQVQQFYTHMLRDARKDSKAGAISPRSVRYCHVILKQALKQALRWRMVAYNVVADVDPPKAVRPRVEAWTSQEMHRFLDTADGDGYAPIWLVALTTGLRKGELLGLRWCDVELDRALLHIRQQVVSVNGRLTTGEPKTRAGRRTIALPSDCVDALRAHHARRPQRPVPLDPAQRDTDPVFASAAGTVIDSRNVSARFDALVARSGVKRITFHGMRHTHATLLLLAGINVKVVSERLGHASIAITLDTYAHLLPGMQETAAEAMQGALQRAV